MVFVTDDARDETIDYILGQLTKHDDRLKEAELDITSLRIELSHHDEEIDSIEEILISHESRISSIENKLSALDGIMEIVNALSQASTSHQTSIEELKSKTLNLDLLPLGTILSYHPKNAETFPAGWLPCDGGNIDKGPLMGQRTPGINTLPNLT